MWGKLCWATDNCVGAHHSPAQVMSGIVMSMKGNEPREILAVLPKKSQITLTTTIERPFRSESYSPSTVQSDFSAQEGVYELLIGVDSDDTFRDVFIQTEFAPWVATTANRFIPPGRQYKDGRTFVQLGCEGPNWVVIEVGWPAS